MEEMDVIVIGAGPAGETVAGRCAERNLEVAIVEHELVGGECSYWGCIPSKTLLRPGDVVAAARRVPGALQVVSDGVDAVPAFAQRDYMTNGWDDTGQVSWLGAERAELVRGRGRLTGERTVEVETPNGQTRQLRARRAVVLATGTGPAIPPIDGLREAKPWDNRDVTSTKQLPRSLLVLGGGAIGAEMAQAMRRLGCHDVTVVEGSERLLSHEEPFAGDEVREAFQAEGIRVHTGVSMTSARRSGPGEPVVATLEDGTSISADEILVAVGRRPATSDLGLETVGLTPGHYVEVDTQLRAKGVPGGWLYAVGDCNGRALLTHMGKYQGRCAADVILGRKGWNGAAASVPQDFSAAGVAQDPSAVPHYAEVIPRVTFTDPQVCAVGLTESQARETGILVRTVDYGTGDVPGSYVQGNRITGTSKLVVDAERSVLVGATFTGPNVQELLHSATVAIVGQVPLERLAHAVPSFPTVSEVWLHLLEAY